jgi:hypothetical protein
MINGEVLLEFSAKQSTQRFGYSCEVRQWRFRLLVEVAGLHLIHYR